MFEVILLVCVFANDYSVDLKCEEQKLDELPSCGSVVIERPEGVMIKGVECRKMTPIAPATEEGVENA